MERIKTIENAIIIFLILFTIVFISILIYLAYPEYWLFINTENTPMTWYQSVLLFAISIFAFFNANLFFLKSEKVYVLLWIIIGFAFLFFSLDEKFMFHEQIRNNILKPKNIRLNFLPWVGVGDFILMVYLLIALIALPFYIKTIKKFKKSLVFLLVGFLFCFFAILADSYDIEKMQNNTLRIEQFMEEISEGFGFTFILISVMLSAVGNIKELIQIK